MRYLLGLVVAALLSATGILLPSEMASPVGGPPSTMDYVALGDSLTTGYGARAGYVPRYATSMRTSTGTPVNVRNLGRNGWTSSDLLRALRYNSNFRRAVRNAEVVTWHIGTNDLREAHLSYKLKTCGGADNRRCLRAATARFKVNWNAILRELLSLRSTRNTVLRTMTVYQPHVLGDKASDTWKRDGGLNDFQAVRPYFRAVNRHIAATATRNSIPHAGVYTAFNGTNDEEDPRARGYLQSDGLHLNDTGHAVYADLLHGLGYAPLG